MLTHLDFGKHQMMVNRSNIIVKNISNDNNNNNNNNSDKNSHK